MGERLTSDVVDGLLVLLHAGQVLCEGARLISRLGALVTQQLRKLLAVLRVLVDSQLQREEIMDNCSILKHQSIIKSNDN